MSSSSAALSLVSNICIPHTALAWYGTSLAAHSLFFFSFFLVSYVGERPRWPIQCLNKGGRTKRKAKRREGSYQVN